MKTMLLSLAAAGTMLSTLASSALAAPVEAQTNEPSAADPDAAASASYGIPNCKTKAFYDLCTAKNAEAYCDITGFHCNFHKQCAEVCFCEPN